MHGRSMAVFAARLGCQRCLPLGQCILIWQLRSHSFCGMLASVRTYCCPEDCDKNSPAVLFQGSKASLHRIFARMLVDGSSASLRCVTVTQTKACFLLSFGHSRAQGSVSTRLCNFSHPLFWSTLISHFLVLLKHPYMQVDEYHAATINPALRPREQSQTVTRSVLRLSALRKLTRSTKIVSSTKTTTRITRKLPTSTI